MRQVRMKWAQESPFMGLAVDFPLWDDLLLLTGLITLTEEQTQLRQDLLAVHGITAAQFTKYCIWLSKGEVFDWDEIQPKVEQVFLQWCGPEYEAV